MLFCCLKALLLLGSKLECSTAKHASVVSNHHRNRLVTFIRSQEPLGAGQQNTGCHKGEWNSFETSYFVCGCVSRCSFRSPEGNGSLDTLNVFSLNAKPLLDSQNLALATNFEFPWTVVIMFSGICISALFFSASHSLSFRCTHFCCGRGVLQVFWGRRRACRMNQTFIKQQPKPEERGWDEMRSEQKGGEKGRRDERIWNAGLQSFWQVVVTFALAAIFLGGGSERNQEKEGLIKWIHLFLRLKISIFTLQKVLYQSSCFLT